LINHFQFTVKKPGHLISSFYSNILNYNKNWICDFQIW